MNQQCSKREQVAPSEREGGRESETEAGGQTLVRREEGGEKGEGGGVHQIILLFLGSLLLLAGRLGCGC